MDLAKYEGWLWLVVALMWLLPMVGVMGSWQGWLSVIAVALVGVSKLQK